MTSARRLASLERDLGLLEAEYTKLLTVALAECAEGRWGLFGTNDAIAGDNVVLDRSLNLDAGRELVARGEEIAEARRRLGFVTGFERHELFVRYRRAARDANAPGEPKLAVAMQQELAELK
jgi:hypothetical protein